MTTNRKYHRLSIKVSIDVNQKLDERAAKLGMTKSGLVTYYIGQGLTLDMQKDALVTPEGLAKMFNNMPGLLEELERRNVKYDESKEDESND